MLLIPPSKPNQVGRESHKFRDPEKDWSGRTNTVALDKGKQEEFYDRIVAVASSEVIFEKSPRGRKGKTCSDVQFLYFCLVFATFCCT